MAFTCSISSGFQLPSCSLTQGGVTAVYIAPWTAATYTLNTDDVVTNITGANFYKFDCVTETAEFTQKSVSNIQNQSLYYDQEVSIIIPIQSAAKRNQYKALASSGVLIIVEDRTGTFNLVGKEQAAFLAEGSVSAGKAAGDRNGYELKWSAKGDEPAFIVSASTSFTSSY